jgi:hypothetical protein
MKSVFLFCLKPSLNCGPVHKGVCPPDYILHQLSSKSCLILYLPTNKNLSHLDIVVGILPTRNLSYVHLLHNFYQYFLTQKVRFFLQIFIQLSIGYKDLALKTKETYVTVQFFCPQLPKPIF